MRPVLHSTYWDDAYPSKLHSLRDPEGLCSKQVQVDMDMPGCVYVHSPLNGQPGTVFAEEHTLVMVSSDLASGRSYTTVSEQPQQALETRSNGPQGTDTFRPKLDPLPDFDAPKMQDWFQRIDMTSYDTLNSMETWFEGLQSHAPSPQNLQTSPDRLVSGNAQLDTFSNGNAHQLSPSWTASPCGPATPDLSASPTHAEPHLALPVRHQQDCSNIQPGDLSKVLPAISVLMLHFDDNISGPDIDLASLYTKSDQEQDAKGPGFRVTRLQPGISRKGAYFNVAYSPTGFPVELHFHTQNPEALTACIQGAQRRVDSLCRQCCEPAYSSQQEELEKQVTLQERKPDHKQLQAKAQVLQDLVEAHQETMRPCDSDKARMKLWRQERDQTATELKRLEADIKRGLKASQDRLQAHLNIRSTLVEEQKRLSTLQSIDINARPHELTPQQQQIAPLSYLHPTLQISRKVAHNNDPGKHLKTLHYCLSGNVSATSDGSSRSSDFSHIPFIRKRWNGLLAADLLEKKRTALMKYNDLMQEERMQHERQEDSLAGTGLFDRDGWQ